MEKPKVSICIVTYNQQNFISDALSSALSQKTDFDYEIIVGDDNSTDNTKIIISEYQKKYPKIIKPVYNKNNIGARDNILNIASIAKGKYIAVLEGDDYWCDEYKLQKQVAFLEQNQEYSLCCHNFYVTKEAENFEIKYKWNTEFFEEEKYIKHREVELNNIFNPYILKMMTILFKKAAVDINELKKYKYLKDILWFAALLENSKGACLNDYMGVYRVNKGGIWSLKSTEEQLRSNAFTLFEISKFFKHKNMQFADLANDDLINLYLTLKSKQKNQRHYLPEVILKRIELILCAKLKENKNKQQLFKMIKEIIKYYTKLS